MSSWEEYKKKKQKNKNISKNINSTNQVSAPTTNAVNWNNVVNRANQILSNTRNVNNLVSIQNPLLNQQTISQRNNNLKDFSNTQRKFNDNDAKNKTNKDKNILSKGKDYVGEIGRSLSFGIVEPFANIASMAYNFPTKLGNALGLETVQQRNAKMGKGISPEEFTNTVKEIENLENERTSQLGTGLRTASRWSRVIGNMIPSILMGQGLAVGNTAEALQKSASAISSFTSALNSGSSTYNETLNEEQDNFLKAGLKAGLYGFATKKIEGITGGNIINKFGSLDDVATKGISKVAKNELQKKILSSVYGAFGETVEENIENWTDHLIDYAFGDAKDITAKSLLDEAKQTSIDTTAVNFIMQLLGMGGATYNDVKLYEAEQKIDSANFLNENQKYAMKEILQENGNPNVADYLLDRQLQKTQQNQATTMQNNEILQQEQQTIPNQDKTAQNQMSQETLGNGKYAIKMPNSNYKFEKSGNEKIDNFRQDVSQNWNNSKETQKLVSTIETIMKDKGVAVRLDANLKDSDGNIADGKYENGTITINPNSNRAFEYIATHELTHAIGTKQMLDMVQRYRQDNQEFNSKVETLLKNYNATELTEEALADVSAQLFGTQEFISNVKNTNPNLFQKIYNEIKYLWHQFRGYKNESQFIDDLYNKWTKAYNSNAELNQTTRNLFAGTNAKNKNITTLKEALKLEEQGKNEQEIFKETGWFRGNDTKWRFETDDSKISFKDDVELEENEVYYLEEFLNADEIFEAYPELKDDVLIRFKDYDDNRVRGEKTKRKALDYEYDEIHINNDVLKDKKELKSVLLHEIQHYIQGKEDFSRGASREYWQEKINDAKRKRDNILKDMEYYHKEIGYDKYKDELFKKADNKEIDFFDIANLLKKYENNSEHSTILKVLRKAYEEANVEYSRLELQGAENLYRNTAGEQESREVQKRVDLTEEERRNELPFITDEKTVYSDADKVYNIAKGGDKDAILSDRRSILSTDTDAKDENTRNRRDNRNINQDEQDRRILQDNKGQDKQGNNKGRNIENNRGPEELDSSSSFNLQKNKEKQLEIIQKHNPMHDDYHTGIRTIEDIKTFDEVINDEESFVYGDFSQEDAKRALEKGTVTVYSSKPIENGNFVSTSRNMAKDYAGNGKIYSKEVPLTDVAWINGDEGQYANTSTKYSRPNSEWQEYLEENFNTEGTRTYGSQIKNGLPQESVLRQNVTNSKKYTTKKETDTEIAKILDTPVTKQKPKDRTWAIIKANILDKGIVFEDLSKRAKNRELEAKWDYTLTSGARAQNAIGNKRYDLSGNVISKGLTEIMDEVGDKINDFQNYMYHQLNVDRMTLKDRLGIDNKPVFGDKIGADYSQRKIAEYEKSNPKFKEWAKDVYDYLKADKAELVKNGVISEELSRKFEELYPHYVPIQRADKLGNAINVPLDTRRTGINTPIKKAKGGSSDINPLFQTMANRTMQTYRASARNSLGVELKNTLQKLNEFKANESNIEDLDNIIETVSNEAQTDELLKASKDGRLPTFTVFQNGEKVTFDISEDIYDALKPTSEALKGMWLKGIPNKISNLRRAVLTEYNPLFSITNTIKDTQDVLLNSQHATKTYLKYPEAYTQILNKGFWYNEYIQNGGGQNTYFKDGDFEVKKTGKLPKAKEIVTFPLEAISKVNNALEMAPRLAEYIASREEGRSIQTSMLDASRVTTNFKAGGDFTKALNRNGATFLNAGVQGTMQAVRNIREANQQGLKGWTVLACKLAVAGAPVWILNNLMWEDDEEYEQLQDYVKDGYYIVGKRDDGTFIRIPKGRTLASIQKVVSNVDKYMNNKEELNIDNVAQDFWETLKFGVENIAPNNPIENNVLSPLFQVATNTSWYGEDIVPERLQNVPKAEQFDETTDKFSKWLGEKLNVSPMKINYLLDQYGGGISDVLLPLGTPQAENTPLEDKFVTDPVMKSKYPGEFFEKADKIDIASNSMYATDTDIVKGKYMSYIQNNMSKLYKEKREIQNSNLSDENKKKQLKEVQKQINETAKMAMEDVEKAKITSTTALIGNEEFYKNSDGEWERLKDEDKLENVSMKSYSDYKIKKEQATDKKRKEKNNDKATLSDKEMIEIIKSSNYTDKEKDALFDDQINDKTYKNLKLLNKNNISKINQYMDYKTADLESDRTDDGTKNGKSERNAEEKFKKYMRSSKFSNIERLYLRGTKYKLENWERTELQNYVKGLGLTKTEQEEIYKSLASSNVVEMNDGEIKWIN